MRRHPARKAHVPIKSSYVRNFVFGVEDSLVSTVGMVSGIAAAGTSRSDIILAGLVLIVVEAFSMGVGSYLSEESEDEYLTHKEGVSKENIINSLIMFSSYFLAGFVPMLPYLLSNDPHNFWYSIFASTFALFLLGAINGIFFRVSPFKNGVKMGVLGGLAITVGILVGQLIRYF